MIPDLVTKSVHRMSTSGGDHGANFFSITGHLMSWSLDSSSFFMVLQLVSGGERRAKGSEGPSPASRGQAYGEDLIVDEIQAGFGRTGKMFAIEHSGVKPDILVMAKGLGNGMPVSAVGASHELMAKWKKGTHGGTYGGGNAIVARAALATIETMQEENIPEKSGQIKKLCQNLLLA